MSVERRLEDGKCYWCAELPEDCECFFCDDCGDVILPGEGCSCDYCGECGGSKANGECECEDA